MFCANKLRTIHIIAYMSSICHRVKTYLKNRARLKTRRFWEPPILFWCSAVVHFTVWFQIIYINYVSLATGTYPLVEKSWRRCCFAFALQCVPVLQCAVFFHAYNMRGLVLNSEEEEMKEWEKPELNLYILQGYLDITDSGAISST